MTEPPATADAAHDHLVHEAVGPALTGLQAGAMIAVGINSLLFAGILPELLGALADEHRLPETTPKPTFTLGLDI